MQELNIPNHVGIIMDGNGRWAKEKGLPRSMGHKAGSENLKDLIKHIFNKGINTLSVFAFATDNFKRSKDEVDYLMNLFVYMFEHDFNELKKEDIKVVFSGRRDKLNDSVLKAMDTISLETINKKKKILNICLNYDGQDEIVDAAKRISELVINKEINLKDINKDLVACNMYQYLEPLDFVIRTSGEYRTSNFMIWQASYAEYYFPKTYFPDFNEKEFDKALIEYTKRSRRFGGIKNEN